MTDGLVPVEPIPNMNDLVRDLAHEEEDGGLDLDFLDPTELDSLSDMCIRPEEV